MKNIIITLFVLVSAYNLYGEDDSKLVFVWPVANHFIIYTDSTAIPEGYFETSRDTLGYRVIDAWTDDPRAGILDNKRLFYTAYFKDSKFEYAQMYLDFEDENALKFWIQTFYIIDKLTNYGLKDVNLKSNRDYSVIDEYNATIMTIKKCPDSPSSCELIFKYTNKKEADKFRKIKKAYYKKVMTKKI